MPDYGKISWQSTKKTSKINAKVDASNPVDALLDFCKDKIPVKPLLKSCTLFSEKKTELHDTYRIIIDQVAGMPFIATFIVWVQEVVVLRNVELLDLVRMLVEQEYIGIADIKKNIWTVEDARSFDHSMVLDAIRSRKDFILSTQEELVNLYISFIYWLSDETYGYVSKLEDPDRIRTRGRILSYSRFIKFLTVLNEKEQLVAKLLYFGGSRTLDEVLSLQIEAVDFDEKLIRFKSQLVNYPSHIFSDIQSLTKNKKSGKVFLGRQDAPLSPATIFRNFKIAAVDTGLEDSFAPAILTSNN